MISILHDADDRQYLSVPVMVPWGPGRLTLVRLNKRWRIGVLVLPMWRTVPESYVIVPAFILGVTSAFAKHTWYADARRRVYSRICSSRGMRWSDAIEEERPALVSAAQFDIGMTSFETFARSLLQL